MNCITSSILHSCVGALVGGPPGDSASGGASAGVVEVAASCSAGGLRFAGGDVCSHLAHSVVRCSRPVEITVF